MTDIPDNISERERIVTVNALDVLRRATVESERIEASLEAAERTKAWTDPILRRAGLLE